MGRVTGRKSPDQGRAATGQSPEEPLAESRPGTSLTRGQSLKTKPNAIRAGIHAHRLEAGAAGLLRNRNFNRAPRQG
ncbi:hypothetical protein TNCT_197071 [Trichonephila clavata]|uniref:Uncharacterized protein n=1 Tax=Trichonephila clavata TaxID=2740835 RepID=A0A8X6JBU9_TRICU|nr:hypothetical protein TNCT_197071 [Trichonephila clavata]